MVESTYCIDLQNKSRRYIGKFLQTMFKYVSGDAHHNLYINIADKVFNASKGTNDCYLCECNKKGNVKTDIVPNIFDHASISDLNDHLFTIPLNPDDIINA